MRRYRIVKCTPDLLLDLCKKNSWMIGDIIPIENALPEDTKCVRVIGQTGDKSNIEISIVVESAEFDDVPEGEVIPNHPDVVFKRVSDGKLSTDANTP